MTKCDTPTSPRARARFTLLVGALAVTTVACLADDAGSEDVKPNVTVLGRATASLASGTITALNGTYTGCVARSGAWSVRVSGASALDNAALSVVTNDTSCVLTLTEIITDQRYTAAAPVALTTAYKGSAVTFTPSGGGPSFSANAKLDSGTFASDFQLSIFYSDDLSSVDAGEAVATYAAVQVSTQTTIVPAPQYTMSLTSGAALTLQIDATKNVPSASGVATLTAGAVLGETYVVDMGILAQIPTYLTVGAAYLLGTEHTLTGQNPQIPAAHLGLVGQSVSSNVVRTVIVAHTVNGVKGYELFKITFKSP